MTQKPNSFLTDDFLKDGVRRYADANATLRAFREGIEERLTAILKARSQWGAFTRAKPLTIESWNAWKAQSHVNARVRGKVKDQATDLTIGLWWDPPCREGSHEVILYACFEDAPEAISKFEFRGSHPGVTHEVLDQARRVFMPPPPDLDLDRDYNRLIDTLLEQVAPGVAVTA